MSFSFIDRIRAISMYEYSRIRRKKSIILLAILALSPVFFLIIVKALGLEVSGPTLWAGLIGLPAVEPAIIVATGPVSFSWIIGLLFGGDLLASELEDHSVDLLLSKPVSRVHVVVGKIIVLTVMLLSFYFTSSITALGVAHYIAGPQADVEVLPLIAVTATIVSLGYAGLAALLGVLLRKSSIAMIAAFILYSILGVISTIILLISVSPSSNPAEFFKIQALIPLVSLSNLPTYTFAYVTGKGLPAIVGSGVVEALREVYLDHLAVSLMTVIGLYIATYIVYSRRDL